MSIPRKGSGASDAESESVGSVSGSYSGSVVVGEGNIEEKEEDLIMKSLD